ncbi:hypothetical protein CLOM_g8373 [Closterium sp. NIES-68]|nr:hypothetical protein CLOM_g8373 [Closterium sp. NIES-68]GJP61333.1 hypothetical protein CLOP_g18504 [Closterium sp. NIES-67]
MEYLRLVAPLLLLLTLKVSVTAADGDAQPSFPIQPSAFEVFMRTQGALLTKRQDNDVSQSPESQAIQGDADANGRQLRQQPRRVAPSSRGWRTMTGEMSRKLLDFGREMRSRPRRVTLDGLPNNAAPQALQAPGLNSAPSAGDINMTWYRWQSVAHPDEVDWRQTIVMTPVLNQMLCESCWALASTDIVSVVWALVNNQTAQPLSPQHVCDCAAGQCCQGGWPEWGFQFILANGGLATNADYPYLARDNSTCRNIAQATLKAKMTGWEKVPVRSNKALMKAVAQQPVLVYLASGTNDFISYSGGIFNSNCSGDIDHAMLLAGYNVTDPDNSYWILKNTWGTNWGEHGYMRLRMLPDGNGKCNVMSENAIYPVFYEKNSKACDVVTPSPCGGGVCEVRGGMARCNCPPGFVERLEESAPKCVTATPCDANPNPCGVGTCNNEFDGTYTCSCPAGSVIGSRTDRAMTCIVGSFQSGLQTYTVMTGDTCQTIADTFGFSVDFLVQRNPFLDCDFPLVADYVLLVADTANFTWGCSAMDIVGPNDTCSSIVSRNGISYRQLVAINPTLNCSGPLPRSLTFCTAPGRISSNSPLIRSCGRVYDASPSERCVDIARGYNISLNDFLWLNPGLKCTDDPLGVALAVCVSSLSTELMTVNCTQWYTVSQGDTCPKIANAVQLPVTRFLRLNPGLRCYAPYFQIGQPVCVAGTTTNIQKITLSPNEVPYTVQANDTLASISADFSTRCPNNTYPFSICESNSLADCTDQSIIEGQMLLIPCKKRVGSNICASSLPVCGFDGVTYASMCDAVNNFALPIVRYDVCNLCNEALCYKKMGQKPPKNSCVAPPGVCPYPTWKLPPEYFDYCPWVFDTQCECLQYTCTYMCKLSASTYTYNLGTGNTWKNATVFYSTCYKSCYDDNLRAGCY